MAVPAALLQQLLALPESERVELAYVLLSSVDAPDELSVAGREQLHAAIAQSLAEIDAGLGVPFDDVIASLRARRARRTRPDARRA
jgi:predicted transcriptional regulator